MLIYRLVKKKYRKNPIDPEGARLYGGRWNSKGKGVIYFADSISLAMLEMLVHIEQRDLLKVYALCSVQVISRMILTLEDSDLPADWQSDPAPRSTALIGDEWVDAKDSLILSIPSTIVPEQRNYIINSLHPEFKKIVRTVSVQSHRFDSRFK